MRGTQEKAFEEGSSVAAMNIGPSEAATNRRPDVQSVEARRAGRRG